jgi:hypothetical protein
MDWVMKRNLRAGDLAGSASVAERLAPYQSPKMSSTVLDVPLPADLMPMPEAIGDDPDSPPTSKQMAATMMS